MMIPYADYVNCIILYIIDKLERSLLISAIISMKYESQNIHWYTNEQWKWQLDHNGIEKWLSMNNGIAQQWIDSVSRTHLFKLTTSVVVRIHVRPIECLLFNNLSIQFHFNFIPCIIYLNMLSISIIHFISLSFLSFTISISLMEEKIIFISI